MSKGWAWVSGVVVSLCIIALMLFARGEREAYWAHRAIVVRSAEQAQVQHRPDRMVIWRMSR